MKITPDMIHEELRFRGRIAGLFGDGMLDKLIRSNRISGGRLLGLLRAKNLQVEKRWIPTRRGGQMSILILKPQQPKTGVPGVLWLHGGGYAVGAAEMALMSKAKQLVLQGAVVISPEYRLSVQAPYPAALHDCYDALLYMKNTADELGVRSDQLFVGGESAGGGLAAALCLYARDLKEVNIAFQMPLYPMLDDRMQTEFSARQQRPGVGQRLQCAGVAALPGRAVRRGCALLRRTGTGDGLHRVAPGGHLCRRYRALPR